MNKLKLTVPTYNAKLHPDQEDFGPPVVPVLVQEVDGVRVVLGGEDINDTSKPDILIERHSNGWMIFLHPIGATDPAGYVYFLDDGRSFLVKEHPAGGPPPLEVLERGETVPCFDRPLRQDE